MNDLKLYFALFAWQHEHDWHAAAGYIFAKNVVNAENLLAAKYGKIRLRSIEEVPIEEGTILYGERWHKV